jgi:dTDP-4-dehydrorhamnose 3,5-epimerase
VKFTEELLPGTWAVQLNKREDSRGDFVKSYARSLFDAAGIAAFDLREEFYSNSRRGVIRGMHFQVPPHAHAKIVFCALGAVEDVLLDLRPGAGLGRVASLKLGEDNPMLLYIPIGVAHGFRSLSERSLMVYKTTAEYAPDHDRGIRWDSFGWDWGSGPAILSERDRAHPALADFTSPF